jgi:hypothetical protein
VLVLTLTNQTLAPKITVAIEYVSKEKFEYYRAQATELRELAA